MERQISIFVLSVLSLQINLVTLLPTNQNGQLFSKSVISVDSATQFDEKDVPPSTINIENIQKMVKTFQSGFKFLKFFEQISPPFQQIVAETSQKNAEFRVLYKMLDGKSPSLSDLFDMVTRKRKSMWDDMVIVSNNNPTVKMIAQMIKNPHPNTIDIVRLLIGKDRNVQNSVVINDKYTITTPLDENQNFLHFVQFLIDNWTFLNKNVFAKLFRSPTNYTGILRSMNGMNFDNFPLSLQPGVVVSGDKYAVMNNLPQGIDSNVDTKLAKILRDIRVLGPQIVQEKDAQNKARDDIFDIFSNLSNALTELIEPVSQTTSGS